MNEQIKQLATEAGLLTGWSVGEVEYQKFAELIVDICRDIAEDGFEEQLDGQEISDQIFEFFRG